MGAVSMEKKHSVVWRSVALGEGIPKVIVSVMGKTENELIAGAENALAAGAQILELRIDSVGEKIGVDEAIDVSRAVRGVSGETPLLFTMRTKRDGGAGSMDKAYYEALLCEVIRSGICDAVDVELSVGEEAFSRIAAFAHDSGVSVVGSSHEFGEIGDVQKVGTWFAAQEALGADVCKAAVMPHSREETLELMLEMVRAGGKLSVPYAAIVMGGMGVMSRVCAAALGSCMTFGSAGQASAPGQIEAAKLREILAILGAGT